MREVDWLKELRESYRNNIALNEIAHSHYHHFSQKLKNLFLTAVGGDDHHAHFFVDHHFPAESYQKPVDDQIGSGKTTMNTLIKGMFQTFHNDYYQYVWATGGDIHDHYKEAIKKRDTPEENSDEEN